VRTFADQAVIAIENARLLGELQARTDELTRSVGELQALEEVLRAVNSSLDLDTVLATIISRAAQLSQADEGTIYEFDETEEVFVPKSAFGMSAERVAGCTNGGSGSARPISAAPQCCARRCMSRTCSRMRRSPAPIAGDYWKAFMRCWRCRCCARTRSLAGW
jgi:GAF domain-containing protein